MFVGIYEVFLLTYGRIVGGRILFRIVFDQVRRICRAGFAVVVRFCVRVDSYREK